MVVCCMLYVALLIETCFWLRPRWKVVQMAHVRDLTGSGSGHSGWLVLVTAELKLTLKMTLKMTLQI